MDQASGWNAYYVVLIAGLFSLLLPMTSALVNTLLRLSREPSPKTVSKKETRSLVFRMNTRYFLGVSIASLLIALTLALVPYSKIFRSQVESQGSETLWVVLFGLLLIGTLLLFAIFYSNRKGDLSWLKTYIGMKYGKSD